jgi:hypothetical protein
LLQPDFGAAEQNFGKGSQLKGVGDLKSECKETGRQAGSLERDLFFTTKLLSGVRRGSAVAGRIVAMPKFRKMTRVVNYIVFDEKAVREYTVEVATEADNLDDFLEAERQCIEDGRDPLHEWIDWLAFTGHDDSDDAHGFMLASSSVYDEEFSSLLTDGFPDIEPGDRLVRKLEGGQTEIVTVARVTPYFVYIEGDAGGVRYYRRDQGFPIYVAPNTDGHMSLIGRVEDETNLAPFKEPGDKAR